MIIAESFDLGQLCLFSILGIRNCRCCCSSASKATWLSLHLSRQPIHGILTFCENVLLDLKQLVELKRKGVVFDRLIHIMEASELDVSQDLRSKASHAGRATPVKQ